MEEKRNSKSKIIFDPLYGHIRLTDVEWDIIHSPFYQRLRWIRQLGFSGYTFPGAEHSRFGHSIGVMFNGHKILQSIGVGLNDEDLFADDANSDEAVYHKSVRLAALMHDLGTFPFSHTTESAYIRFGDTTNKKDGKGLPDDHEHLGSYIIKNTDYETGITHILKKYGFDPQKISDLVKGVDPSILANQILHSEIDCDRMDYLLRDAHYTGLKYGEYDRDYLLHHFKLEHVAGHRVLSIKHNALYCVEDFLSARFAWYSQVLRSARGARFDALAESVTFYLLENGKMIKYADLLDQVANNPVQFYRFNDSYFMNLIHDCLTDGSFDKDPKIKDMAECLLFEKAPKAIRLPEFSQRLLDQDEGKKNEKIYLKAIEKYEEIKEFLDKNGGESDWIIPDIPKKNVLFVRSEKQVVKKKEHENVLLERDPVKITMDDGSVKLLASIETSIISRLQNTYNFIPNVFCSRSAHARLKESGLIE